MCGYATRYHLLSELCSDRSGVRHDTKLTLLARMVPVYLFQSLLFSTLPGQGGVASATVGRQPGREILIKNFMTEQHMWSHRSAFDKMAT